MANEPTPAAPAAPATTTPPAAPAAPATPPPDLTDVMRDEQRGAAMDSLLGLPKKDKAAKKDKPAEPTQPAAPAAAAPTTPTTTPAEPAAPATPPAQPNKLKVKMPQPRQAPASLSAEEIARISANTAAEMHKLTITQAPKSEDDLPDDLKRMAPVYAEMEKLFPEKYKGGIAKQIQKFRTMELQRADKWEAEHPGQAYNADDDEHADFYAKNEFRVDSEDVDEARFELRYRQRVDRDITPKLQEANRTTQLLRAEPDARRFASEVSQDVIAELLPEGAKLTDEEVKKWSESDPVSAEVATEISKQVLPVVYNMSLLWDGVEKFDERKAEHVQARRLLNDFESELNKADPEQLVNDEGQQWVSLAKYNSIPDSQKGSYYTTSKQNLANYARIRAANAAKHIAKERKEFAEKYAQRMGYAKQPASGAPPVTQQPAPTAPTPAAPPRPSPSIGGGSPTPPAVGTASTTTPPAIDPVGKMLGL